MEDELSDQESQAEKSPEKQLSRQVVLNALDYGIQRFDSHVHEPGYQSSQAEKQALTFIAQARGRTDFKKDVDTYQNKFYGESGKVYVEGEGIPVETLIAFLKHEALTTKNPTERRRQLKNAQILEDYSRPFYEIHSSMGPEALAARENQEAQNFGGDLDKAKEVLTNRRELIPPAAKPKPPKLPSTELTFGMVAGKQRIEHTDQSGKKVEEMEVLEERVREIASLRMTEDRTKWEGRFSFVRQFIPRLWKSTIGRVATYGKEKGVGIKLLAQSGIQMTTLPHQFIEQVDDLARQNIAKQRSGIRKRVWGAIKDVFHEATFTEKDLHQERIKIIGQLRGAFEHIDDPDQQKFLTEHTLGAQFVDILNGDYQGSEALAKRVNSEFGDEVIHGVVGEKRTGEAVKLEGPVADFFKQDIIAPLLSEGMANGTISETTIMIARKNIQEFFLSKRFIDWYNDPRNESIRENLNLSLSYGSDLIPLIQEVILPQVLQAKEHIKSANNLEAYVKKMVLKVNVGTLEAGQKGVIEEGLLERSASRSITNERVMQLYEQLRTANKTPKLVPDTYLDAAVNRATLVGKLGSLATNHIALGIATGVGLYAARAGAGTVGRLIVPIVGGGVVAGAFRALEERRIFTREHEQHEVESELGYKFPPDAPRREQMRSLELHKRQMEAELTIPMQQIITEIKSGNPSKDRLMELTGLIADSKARSQIMDARGVGLLSSSDPQKYQVERTRLEITQAQAQTDLKTYLETHPNLGLQDLSVDALIRELTDVQIKHLERGVGIDAQFQAALGNLTIERTQSIEAREQAFRDTRRNRMIVAGATTAVGAVGGYFLSNFAVNKAAEFALARDIPVVGAFLREHGFERVVRSDKLGNVNLNEAFDHPKGYNFEDPTTHERYTLLVNADGNNPDRMVDIVDAHGQKLGLPMWLAKDGDHTKIIAAGSADNLPPGLKNYVSEWQQNPTNEHNLRAYMERLTSGGVKNTPDQVLHQGSVDMNTHDITQSSSLNPDKLSYDDWAAKMGRINPATGGIEEGKMSITISGGAQYPEGIRLHGFDRADGSFDVGKDYYVGPNYPSNSSLTTPEWGIAAAKLQSEGWTVEQTPTGLHISAPGATEYIPMEKQFIPTDFGIPFIEPRVPPESPEKPKTQEEIPNQPDKTEPVESEPKTSPPSKETPTDEYEKALAGIAEALRENRYPKAKEYAERIKAVDEGNEIVTGDSAHRDELLREYGIMAGQPYDPENNATIPGWKSYEQRLVEIDKKIEQATSTEKKLELIQEGFDLADEIEKKYPGDPPLMKFAKQVREAADIGRAKFLESIQSTTVKPPQNPPAGPVQPTPASTATPPPDELDSETSTPSNVQLESSELLPSEGEDILRHTEIHGEPFYGERLTKKVLEEEGLLPKYQVNVDGENVYLSDTYTADNDGRIAVVGYVQGYGKYIARTFYRSNSQGIWRYLPQYRLGSFGTIDWYSKGHKGGEESIQLPIDLQKALAEISKTAPGSINKNKLVFAGTARNVTNPGTFFREVHSTPIYLDGNLYSADRTKKVAPEEVTIKNLGENPDFEKLIESWTQNTSLYGPITIDTFPSKDGKLKYMFCKDIKGRAWIAGIENSSPMQSVGLRQSWINAGDLTTPAYEYSGYTGGYENSADSKGSYRDMFYNYLSKIPVIRNYLAYTQTPITRQDAGGFTRTIPKPQSTTPPERPPLSSVETGFPTPPAPIRPVAPTVPPKTEKLAAETPKPPERRNTPPKILPAGQKILDSFRDAGQTDKQYRDIFEEIAKRFNPGNKLYYTLSLISEAAHLAEMMKTYFRFKDDDFAKNQVVLADKILKAMEEEWAKSSSIPLGKTLEPISPISSPTPAIQTAPVEATTEPAAPPPAGITIGLPNLVRQTPELFTALTGKPTEELVEKLQPETPPAQPVQPLESAAAVAPTVVEPAPEPEPPPTGTPTTTVTKPVQDLMNQGMSREEAYQAIYGTPGDEEGFGKKKGGKKGNKNRNPRGFNDDNY